MKSYSIPTLFLLISFWLDFTITEIRTASDRSLEGNKVVVKLWEVLGNFQWLLPILWLTFIFCVCFFLIKKKHPKITTWLLYTIGASHLLGFLSWTTPLYHYFFKITWFLNHAFPFLNIPYFPGTIRIIVIAAVLSLLLTHLHFKSKGARKTPKGT